MVLFHKSGFKRAYLIILLAFAIALVTLQCFAPLGLRAWLVSQVQQTCDTCELRLGPVGISLIPLSFQTRDLQFSGGDPSATAVTAEVKWVRVPISLFSLLMGKFHLGTIEITGAKVQVTEGDLDNQGSKSRNGESEAAPNIEINSVLLTDSFFKYTREHKTKKATVSISHINVSLGPLGNSNRLIHEKAEGTATGLLEGVGEFTLTVGAELFSKEPKIDVKLQMSELNLNEVNRFFIPNDGVELRGTLHEGRSTVKIRGGGLVGSVYARYSGLDIKIKNNESRSRLSAFFQSLLTDAKLGAQNSDGRKYDRSGISELQRLSDESIISFILRGMKEAAMTVATQGED